MSGSKLLSSFAVYGVANAFGAGAPVLILPFLTDYLTPTDLGLIANFGVVSNILIAVIGLSFSSTVTVYFFDKRVKPMLPEMITFGGLAMVLFGSFLLVSGKLVESELVEWMAIPFGLLVFAVVHSVFEQVVQAKLNSWRMEEKALLYGVFRVVRTSLELGLSVLVVLQFTQSWEGRLFGQVGVTTLFGLITLALLVKNRELKLSFPGKEARKELLSFNSGYMPHVLGGSLINYADIFFISAIMTLADTGNYSVAYQIGLIVALAQNSFNQAFAPWLFRQLSEENPDKILIVRVIYGFISVLILGALLLTAFSETLYNWFIDSKFEFNFTLVSLLIAAYTVNGIYKVFVNFILFKKDVKRVRALTLIAAGLNLVLNIALIPVLGLVGAGIATLCAFGMQAVLAAYFGIKKVNMPWLKGLRV